MNVTVDVEYYDSFDCPLSDYFTEVEDGIAKEDIEKMIINDWKRHWGDWIIIHDDDISIDIKITDEEFEALKKKEIDHFEIWARVVRESRERRLNDNRK